MGQGANTVMTQICADALGVDMSRIATLGADTDTTPDAGKSSASRQTFVSGNATFLAASALRARLLALAGASDDAHLELDDSRLVVHDRGAMTTVDLTSLDADADGLVAVAQRDLRPAHDGARRGRAGRSRTRSSGSARTSPSSKSTSSSGRCVCDGSRPRTTWGGR